METIGKAFVFEPNDEATRKELRNSIQRFMSDIVHRGGIKDFKAICDNTNNTPKTIDSGSIVVDLCFKKSLKPDYLHFKYTLSPYGSKVT